MGELHRFVSESNAIEGIRRKPTEAELEATSIFINTEAPMVDDVVRLVAIYQPDAVLRDRPGLNVYVGNHVPPPGGPDIAAELAHIVSRMTVTDPWVLHVEYETLHPFTDGNGRSGRAIWAWQMARRQQGLPLGFLHQFYYQTLANSRPYP